MEEEEYTETSNSLIHKHNNVEYNLSSFFKIISILVNFD